jgi:hypothetical protein
LAITLQTSLIMLTDSAIPASLLPPNLVEGEGFEPSKAVPSDLQSDPFDRSGTPPNETMYYECIMFTSQRAFSSPPNLLYD